MAGVPTTFLFPPYPTKPPVPFCHSTNFTSTQPISTFLYLPTNPCFLPHSRRSTYHHRQPPLAFLKEGFGQVRKKLSNFTTLNYWVVRDYYRLVDSVNVLEPRIQCLSDDQLKAKTDEFRRRLALGESLADIQAEAFAVVREAAKRTLGMCHFDVQIIGGAVLHYGSIAEMNG